MQNNSLYQKARKKVEDYACEFRPMGCCCGIREITRLTERLFYSSNK